MIRSAKRMRLCCTLICLCLTFIWGNSLVPGEISGAISEAVRHVLEMFLPAGEASPSNGGFLIRKLAHFTEFAALGMCLGWLFGMLQRGAFPALFWGAAAACTDEFIQRFVPHRGPSLRDVGVDTCGVLTGLILLYLGHHYLCKYNKRKFGG